MNLHRNRISRQLNEEHPRTAWIYVSTKVDTYQQQPAVAAVAVVEVAGQRPALPPLRVQGAALPP
jgi:hypothetical protein